MLVSTSRYVRDLAPVLIDDLERAGLTIVVDTCTYQSPAVRGCKVPGHEPTRPSGPIRAGNAGRRSLLRVRCANASRAPVKGRSLARSSAVDELAMIRARVLNPGEAKGPALVLAEPLSILGRLRAQDRTIIDVHHPQNGENLVRKDRVSCRKVAARVRHLVRLPRPSAAARHLSPS